ncbi:aminotransferase class V-fold PLP-dependent enzyme [Alphaproteobacteria bacterium GH1-50]|uniref:Aminotransferase class V-fold PLP-dependent enzyme n=1 Tax=Kangsaoukella pontilimi TaxID=2691042 RepID=A0A7C9MAB9_9RHOB|nr:aminotransferase class V-fold PLP-dependent enzyme [Kangsaoukella pontilimi]MXQ07913.1 aminotransferase class V-fold PLP-dependent enzyme [Kangsaoukella pontilimi]
MTLSQGRPYLATPGPSVIPDRVLAAMHRPAPNIYEGELVEMVPGLIRDLKKVARTDGHAAIYIANGHGAWEAALSNVLSPGDRLLVPAMGSFARGWADMAERLGAVVDIVDCGTTHPVDPQAVAERLARDDGSIRAVLTTHVDTSSSVRADIEALGQAIRETGHPALFMVDCIASLGCDVYEMDAWGVDVTVAACQKGLMTPPGMAFVFFNDRADRVRETARAVTHYWDWRPRVSPELFYHYFDGTAPTHHLYGLREALDMIAEEGLEHVWQRHATLARAVWAALDCWSTDGGVLSLNVPDAAARSHAVTSIRAGGENGARLRDWCTREAGLTLGIGLGFTPQDQAFRIGHMGHVNAQMVLAVLGSIGAGLRALGLPHGAGAIDAALSVIAEGGGPA